MSSRERCNRGRLVSVPGASPMIRLAWEIPGGATVVEYRRPESSGRVDRSGTLLRPSATRSGHLPTR